VCDIHSEIEARQAELESVQVQVRPLQQRMSVLQVELKELRRKLECGRREPDVSDHAVIRYLERVGGFCFDNVRQEIMTSEVRAAIAAGARSVRRNGVTFIIRDQSVVTCVR